MKPKGYTDQLRQQREYEEDIKANMWRLFCELRDLRLALDSMNQNNLLVQNAQEKADAIEQYAESLYW